MTKQYSFDGGTFSSKLDGKRLSAQFEVVRKLMLDGEFRSLEDIQKATGFPPTSISARIRDLRKPRFGSYKVESVRVSRGLYVYRIVK